MTYDLGQRTKERFGKTAQRDLRAYPRAEATLSLPRRDTTAGPGTTIRVAGSSFQDLIGPLTRGLGHDPPDDVAIAGGYRAMDGPATSHRRRDDRSFATHGGPVGPGVAGPGCPARRGGRGKHRPGGDASGAHRQHVDPVHGGKARVRPPGERSRPGHRCARHRCCARADGPDPDALGAGPRPGGFR